jgi:hypothetical protein
MVARLGPYQCVEVLMAASVRHQLTGGAPPTVAKAKRIGELSLVRDGLATLLALRFR